MKMKKVCCLMLGGLAVFGLCGCGKNNSSGGNDNTNSSTTQNVDEKTLVTYHTPEEIKKRGELKVGVVTQKPEGNGEDDLDGGINYLYAKSDDGNYEGFNVELSNQLGHAIDPSIKITFVEYDNDQKMLDALASGEVDIALSSLTYTNSLAASYTLSDSYWPYQISPTPFFVLDSAKDKFKSLDDLSSLKLAVAKGYGYEQPISENLPNAQLVLCEDTNECIDKLKKGEADAIFCDADLLSMSLKDDKSIVQSSVTIPDDPSKVGLFIAMMKDNEELKATINASISKFKTVPNAPETSGKDESSGSTSMGKHQMSDMETWLTNAFKKAYQKKFESLKLNENSGNANNTDVDAVQDNTQNAAPDAHAEKSASENK